MKRPTMPPMKPTGTKIATSDSVVASTARPISCGRVDRGLERVLVLLLDEAVDVLQHDDRVVDDDADRERQRQHRHHVEREAHVPDQAEGGDDRGRDRDRGDDRRAQVARNSSTTSAARIEPTIEVLLDVVDRGFDEVRECRARSGWCSRAAAPRCSSSSLARALRSTTSTVLVPDCRRTVQQHRAGAVDVGDACRRRPRRPRPRATSAIRTGWPFCSRTTMSSNSATRLDAAARAQRHRLSAPWSTRPPGISMFCACSARETSVTVRL